MRFTGWVCSLLLLCAGFGAHADCISQSEMAEIAGHFSQFDNLKNAEYCLDDSPTSRLLSGIMFMRKTAFAAQMPTSADELFSGKFASDWYQYFIGRIDAFEVQSSCPKGVVAYVYFFGTSMYVCPAALTPNFTSLDLASVFMHEARHIDGFPHVTCSHGPRAGLQGACDSRIGDGGSYAVTVETYAQIAKYATDLHPALRAYSRAASVIYADEAFENQVRIDRTPQFLVMSNTGEFSSMNGQGQLKSLGKSPALGQISMRAQFMVLYPEDKTLKAKYLFVNNEGEINQEAGDIAIEYNSQTPAQRADWVGVHIAAQWSTKVLKNKLVFTCDPRAATVSEVSTNGEVPASIVYPNGYDRAASSASIIMESGKVYDFGCQGTSAYLRQSSLVFDQPYKRIQKQGNDVIGLGKDGKLYKINGSTSTVLSTSLDGRIYDLAPYQSFSFFD
jgi:hypothetical protein